jgi:hypothetical protein
MSEENECPLIPPAKCYMVKMSIFIIGIFWFLRAFLLIGEIPPGRKKIIPRMSSYSASLFWSWLALYASRGEHNKRRVFGSWRSFSYACRWR